MCSGQNIPGGNVFLPPLVSLLAGDADLGVSGLPRVPAGNAGSTTEPIIPAGHLAPLFRRLQVLVKPDLGAGDDAEAVGLGYNPRRSCIPLALLASVAAARFVPTGPQLL